MNTPAKRRLDTPPSCSGIILKTAKVMVDQTDALLRPALNELVNNRGPLTPSKRRSLGILETKYRTEFCSPDTMHTLERELESTHTNPVAKEELNRLISDAPEGQKCARAFTGYIGGKIYHTIVQAQACDIQSLNGTIATNNEDTARVSLDFEIAL